MTDNKTSGSRWLALVLLNSLLIQAGVYVVRPIVSFKALELGADAFLVGIIGALFAVAPLLFAIRIGKLVDTGRAGQSLAAGTLLLFFVGIGLLFVETIPLLMLAMPLLGMGHLLVMVGGQTLIANRSETSKYEKNFGLLTFYASIGHAFGPLIGGWLADSPTGTVNADAAFGFAIALYFVAILGVIKLATKVENQPILRQTEERASAREVLAVPTMKQAIFVASASTSVIDVVLIFLPVLAREIGLSVAEVGLLLAIRSIASMAVRLVLGQLSQKLGLRRILIWGSASTLVSMIALALVENFWIIALIMAVSGFAMGIGQPATMAWVSRISNPDRRGLAIAVRLTANRLGQVMVPAIAGVVAGAGVGSVFCMLAVVLGAAIYATGSSLKPGE